MVIYFSCSGTLSKPALLIFTYELGNEIKYTEDSDLIRPLHNVTVPANDSSEIFVNITGSEPGHLILGINSSSPEFDKYAYIILVVSVMFKKKKKKN